jgi:hypothetical protein
MAIFKQLTAEPPSQQEHSRQPQPVNRINQKQQRATPVAGCEGP